MYMVLLSIFNVLLFKLSTQTEIVIGVDTGGRTHPDFQEILGVFINTLVLRTFPGREKTFHRFLQEIKTKTLEIFENQDYPFDLLADKLVKTWNPSRNPLFDVMFSYEHFEIKPLEIPAALRHLTLKPYNKGVTASKLDMNVKARAGDVIEIIIEYKTGLFTESTIQRYAGYFKEIVDAVTRDPEILLKDIKITHDLLPINQDISSLELEF
jgi:iturin family lipopeptide synthetase A